MTREELKSADTRSLISALQYCGRDSYYATYYDEVVDEITKRLNRIADLEKENAELRKELEEADNATDCFNKQEEIIAKAKEIIKGLLSFVDSLGNYSGGIFARAEQFLKGE